MLTSRRRRISPAGPAPPLLHPDPDSPPSHCTATVHPHGTRLGSLRPPFHFIDVAFTEAKLGITVHNALGKADDRVVITKCDGAASSLGVRTMYFVVAVNGMLCTELGLHNHETFKAHLESITDRPLR